QSADSQRTQEMPVWIITGEWKRDRLAALAGDASRKAGRPPEQIPEQVELILGDTEVLPLFPYPLTHRHASEPDSRSKSAMPQWREMLRLELYNVTRDPTQIDPREFQFQPGDQEVEELTPFYVQRYSGETKLR